MHVMRVRLYKNKKNCGFNLFLEPTKIEELAKVDFTYMQWSNIFVTFCWLVLVLDSHIFYFVTLRQHNISMYNNQIQIQYNSI